MRNLSSERCTREDYRRLFAGSAERLQWLCYVLTANQEISENLLNAALEQSLKGSDQVFREWMVSWARRLIIRVCIENMRPQIARVTQSAYLLPPMRLEPVDEARLSDVLSMPAQMLQERLLQLDVLSRFVVVLRALEGYSRREASLFLNIDDRTCEWIYLRALESLQCEPELPEAPLAGVLAQASNCYSAQS